MDCPDSPPYARLHGSLARTPGSTTQVQFLKHFFYFHMMIVSLHYLWCYWEDGEMAKAPLPGQGWVFIPLTRARSRERNAGRDSTEKRLGESKRIYEYGDVGSERFYKCREARIIFMILNCPGPKPASEALESVGMLVGEAGGSTVARDGNRERVWEREREMDKRVLKRS